MIRMHVARPVMTLQRTGTPLRIGILAPIAWPIPPECYGGWEYVAGMLAEGLVRRGHDVTLFATAEARTGAKLRWVCPRPLMHDRALHQMARVYETLHLANALEHALEFDVLHNHLGCIPVSFSHLSPVPIVTTLHGSAGEEDSRRIYNRYRGQPYVSNTHAERTMAPHLNYVKTVYNGVDLGQMPFVAEMGEYLLYAGRIAPDKGVHNAVQVAQHTGVRLVIAGFIPPEYTLYFDRQIAPHLRPGQVEFVGEVNAAEKGELFGRARAFLYLITRREAAGLTMIEAMAAGTPVIAFPHGAVPEVVRHGQTGFVVADVAAACAAVGRIHEIDRVACRRHVAQRFTTEQMVIGYEDAYRCVLGM